MKNWGHGALECWSKGGSHAEDIARAKVPGSGLQLSRDRVSWCVKCQCDRQRKGGHYVGNLWFCALHPVKVVA